MRGAGIQFRQEFHRLSAYSKRDRHLDAVFGVWLPMPYIEFEETGILTSPE